MILGDSAGGSLKQALRLPGGDGENVLSCPDDFSCGPISSLAPASRTRWWGQFHSWYATPEAQHRLGEFWSRLDTWNGKLVLWFGRGSASELAFLHALVDRLQGRTVFLADVTGHQYAYTLCFDGKLAVGGPAKAASLVQPEGLRDLLGKEREATEQELSILKSRWEALVQENAPFRIATSEGLFSAPADHFDSALLEASSREWISVNRIVGKTMCSEKADMQVGDVLLRFRVAVLVEQGSLQADGEALDNCRIRLAENMNL